MKKAAYFIVLFAILGTALPAQTITVTSPAAGAMWLMKSSHAITWTSTGLMKATVAIRLRRAGSPESEAATLAIANGEANDGAFSWTVPDTVAPGNYFIRVRTDDSSVIGDSGTFSIAPALPPPPPPPTPSLTIISPNNGEQWRLLSDQAITWKAVNVTGKVKLELVKYPGGMLGVIAKDLNPYSGSHPWKAGKYGINQTAPAGGYRVIVRSQNNFQLSDQSDQPFTLKHLWATPHESFALNKPDLVMCMETALYLPLMTLGYVHIYVRNIGTGTTQGPPEIEIITFKGDVWRRTLDRNLVPGEAHYVLRIGEANMKEATSMCRAIADPDNHIAESNEGNNSSQSFVFIEEGNPTYSTPIYCGDGSTVQ